MLCHSRSRDAACLGIVNASGPIAVYALVDKVALEPNADQPERVRISGVFIVAEERSDVYGEESRDVGPGDAIAIPPTGRSDPPFTATLSWIGR